MTTTHSPAAGFVLPRRMSRERYDDVTDERKGANTMITAAPDFSDIKAQTVGVREWWWSPS